MFNPLSRHALSTCRGIGRSRAICVDPNLSRIPVPARRSQVHKYHYLQSLHLAMPHVARLILDIIVNLRCPYPRENHKVRQKSQDRRGRVKLVRGRENRKDRYYDQVWLSAATRCLSARAV